MMLSDGIWRGLKTRVLVSKCGLQIQFFDQFWEDLK